MAEKYVSPEYKTTLDELARELVTPQRFGGVALSSTVEIPENVVLGEE